MPALVGALERLVEAYIELAMVGRHGTFCYARTGLVFVSRSLPALYYLSHRAEGSQAAVGTKHVAPFDASLG